MDSYTLKYTLKDSSQEKEYKFRDKHEVLSFVRNLHRGVATLNGVPVYGLEAFSFFQIWLLNYSIDLGDGRYLDFLLGDTSNPITVSDEPGFKPIDGDVTNEILDEVNFSSRDKNMEFKSNTLRVYGELFDIKKESKLRDLLEIIFSSKEKFMSYDEMKEIHNKGEYKELLEKDLYNEGVRGLMKYKQNEIKNELNLKELAFSITIKGITKNI